LERGLLPTGASTKNAGFACMGSPTELLDDLQHDSEEQVLQLFMLRKKGLERLQSILGVERLGYQASGSYELLFQEDLNTLDQLEYLNQLLHRELHTQAFSIATDQLPSFQFNTQQVKALIENLLEGSIDTGLMMYHYLALVRSLGIECMTGAFVTSFHEENNRVTVTCTQGAQAPIEFHAKHLCICNNAFAKTLLPEYEVIPGRGQVLITKPIEALPFQGIFHFNQGYYYFRAVGDRVLFGGGRNLDKQTENTTDFALNDQIQQDLNEKLRTLILPNQAFEIDQRWVGIMAFGSTKTPILKQHSSRVYVGVRMGGMGVAIGSEIGFRLSEMIET
jgi:glycine/D-amino acid oxidase-like deaminating enzyme